jgi:hypothetical protein
MAIRETILERERERDREKEKKHEWTVMMMVAREA